MKIYPNLLSRFSKNPLTQAAHRSRDAPAAAAIKTTAMSLKRDHRIHRNGASVESGMNGRRGAKKTQENRNTNTANPKAMIPEAPLLRAENPAASAAGGWNAVIIPVR